jgi:hypothetical protein
MYIENKAWVVRFKLRHFGRPDPKIFHVDTVVSVPPSIPAGIRTHVFLIKDKTFHQRAS